jgi:hypothetical protein
MGKSFRRKGRPNKLFSGLVADTSLAGFNVELFPFLARFGVLSKGWCAPRSRD